MDGPNLIGILKMEHLSQIVHHTPRHTITTIFMLEYDPITAFLLTGYQLHINTTC